MGGCRDGVARLRCGAVTGSNSLEPGIAALDAGRYQEARAAFKKALAVEASAAGYDGLAQALRWMGDGGASLAAREEAYRLYREGGDAARAGLTAAWLAWDTLLLRGDWAVAQGWIARAERLLDDAPKSVERAWLVYVRALLALYTLADAHAAEQQAHEAAELGSEHGEADLEFGARSVRGLARVALGDVPGGMRDLDEASAAAVAGEVRNPMMAGLVWCNVIYACERVHDVERAAQWCAIVRAQAERIQSRQLFGFAVVITRGCSSRGASGGRQRPSSRAKVAGATPAPSSQTSSGRRTARRTTQACVSRPSTC